MGRTRKVSFGGDGDGFVSPSMGSLAMAVDIAEEEAILLIQVGQFLRVSCRDGEERRERGRKR